MNSRWFAKFVDGELVFGPQSVPGDDSWVEVVVEDVEPGCGGEWCFNGPLPRYRRAQANMEHLVAAACQEVDRFALGLRGVALHEEHEWSYQEAKDYLAGKKGGKWSCIEPDVERKRCSSLRDAAELIVSKHDAWKNMVVAVRRERLLAKESLRGAQRIEDVAAIKDAAMKRIVACFERHSREQENGK